jgi:hypothetical protein
LKGGSDGRRDIQEQHAPTGVVTFNTMRTKVQGEGQTILSAGCMTLPSAESPAPYAWRKMTTEWVLGRPEARAPSSNQLARAPGFLLAVCSHHQDMVVSASARSAAPVTPLKALDPLKPVCSGHARSRKGHQAYRQ